MHVSDLLLLGWPLIMNFLSTTPIVPLCKTDCYVWERDTLIWFQLWLFWTLSFGQIGHYFPLGICIYSALFLGPQLWNAAHITVERTWVLESDVLWLNPGSASVCLMGRKTNFSEPLFLSVTWGIMITSLIGLNLPPSRVPITSQVDSQ